MYSGVVQTSYVLHFADCDNMEADRGWATSDQLASSCGLPPQLIHCS